MLQNEFIKTLNGGSIESIILKDFQVKRSSPHRATIINKLHSVDWNLLTVIKISFKLTQTLKNIK